MKYQNLSPSFQADSDEDLAELEAELYSQIYYEPTDQSCISSSKSSEFNVSDYIVNDVSISQQDVDVDTSRAMERISREKVDTIGNIENTIENNKHLPRIEPVPLERKVHP